MLLSVIIPALNEEGNLSRTLQAIRRALEAESIPYEIVVVDDGSTDATASIVETFSKGSSAIRLVKNVGEHGYGLAVRCGLDVYRGDAVVISMADLSDDPADIVRYYNVLKDGADCVFGSRFIKGSKVVGYPKFKRIINRVANKIMSLLFRVPYNDITNAFKGYRSEVIEGCRPLLSKQFNLTIEIPLKAIIRGFSFKVIPVSWTNREVGTSSFHIKEMGSRYLFVMLYALIEKWLVSKDYHRRPMESVLRQRPASQKPGSVTILRGELTGISYRGAYVARVDRA